MRPIDVDALKEKFEDILDRTYTDDYAKGFVAGLYAALNMPTLTPPNEWVSVEDTVPDPGERVLAAKGTFVGEAYLASNGAWMRHDGFPWEVDAWMPLPAPPGKDNNVPAKDPNEPLTLEQLCEMDGKPVWIVRLEDNLGWWAIVRLGNDRSNTDYGAYFMLSDYGKTWLAYAYPPAHIDREAWTAEWKE